MKEIIRLVSYIFKVQIQSAKVWLGCMVGIVYTLNRCMEYIRFADKFGEPVNVLDVFLIVLGDSNRVVFFILGWLLIVSAAPFIDRETSYIIYRTSKKRWNSAVVLYLFVQAVIYYVILCTISIVVSVPNGYVGNIWSYPLTMVAKRFCPLELSFPYLAVIKTESVYACTLHTLILAILYAVVIGYIGYVISLYFKSSVGVFACVMVHFLGYEIMKEGLGFQIDYSLLARSIAMLQMGNTAMVSMVNSYLLFFIVMMLCLYFSGKRMETIDMDYVSKEGVE